MPFSMTGHCTLLLRASVMALVLAAHPAMAAPVGAQTWRDVLAEPLIEPDMARCSRTHPVRAVPQFGDGLIARYTISIDRKQADPDAIIAEYFEDWRRQNGDRNDPFAPIPLPFPRHVPRDATEITVEHGKVLRTMDDLLAGFSALCEMAHRPGFLLTDIAWRAATRQERARSPGRLRVPTMAERRNADPPVEPVRFVPEEPGADILPPPVPGGSFAFGPVGSRQASGPGMLPDSPAYHWRFDPTAIPIGTGLHAAVLADGATDLESMAKQMNQGFVPILLNQNGSTRTVILDSTLLDTPAKVAERVSLLVRQSSSVMYAMRGRRLVLYPARLGVIDALPTYFRRDLQNQVLTLQAEWIAQQVLREKAMPEEADIETIVKRDWSHFAGSAGNHGYDALFGGPGTTFGGLDRYRLACDPPAPGIDQHLFACRVSALFLDGKRARLERRTLMFERVRDGDDTLTLHRHDPPEASPDPLIPAPAADEPPGAPPEQDTPPTLGEIKTILHDEWLHPSNGFAPVRLNRDPQDSDLNDLHCDQNEHVFSCYLFMATTEGGHMINDRIVLELMRTRNAAGAWVLGRHEDPQIIVTDFRKAPAD